jgi:hypothetical protein
VEIRLGGIVKEWLKGKRRVLPISMPSTNFIASIEIKYTFGDRK